jgi:hypothetical protein
MLKTPITIANTIFDYERSIFLPFPFLAPQRLLLESSKNVFLQNIAFWANRSQTSQSEYVQRVRRDKNVINKAIAIISEKYRGEDIDKQIAIYTKMLKTFCNIGSFNYLLRKRRYVSTA